MATMTANGSGGSRLGEITNFDGSDDFDRQLAEIKGKVDGIDIGEIALRGMVPRPSVDWLGLQAMRPSLGLHRPSEAAILQMPVLEPLEVNGQYN
jgi:hypothetical protein